MPNLSALSHVGLAKESTLGVYVAPTIYVPVTDPRPEDVKERILDESLDANNTKVRGIYDGIYDSTYDYGGPAYDTVLGPLFVALGFLDTTTGAGPFLHTFKQPATGIQPGTTSITDYNSFEARGWVGSMLSEVNFKIDSKGMVTYTTKWKGFPSGAQSTPTPNFTTAPPFLAWQGALSFNAVNAPRMLSADITIKRPVDAIHVNNNTQSPTSMFAGPVETQAKFKLLFNDNTEMTKFLTNVQQPIVVTVTQPSAGPVLTFTWTKNGLIKAPVMRTDNYATLELDIEGFYSATDLGPCAITLSNSVAAAY